MTQVFEYTYAGQPITFPSVLAFLPTRSAGALILGAGLISFFATVLLIHLSRSSKLVVLATLLTVCLLATGMFMVTHLLIDEVFVNLEHPWNLYHHGRFSFSSQEMIDGTVEIPYYGFLTPFSGSHRSLLVANYVLGLIISIGHGLIVWRILDELTSLGRLLGTTFFLFNGAIAAVLSSGFGNGLVSLLLLLAILFQKQGRSRAALGIAAAMPLVRVDALLYGLCVLFADMRERRRVPVAALAGLGCAVAASLTAAKLMYDHWILTPALFKSNMDWNYFCSLGVRDLPIAVRQLSAPFLLVSLAAIPPAVLWSARSSIIERLKPYFLASILLLLFFTVQTGFTAFWRPERYALGAYVVLAIAPAWLLGFAADYLRQGVETLWRTFAIVPLVLLGAALSWHLGYIQLGHTTITHQRVNGLASGGIILDNLLPPDWTVAAHEINSVGYFTERPIMDLWGYTNRSIATSRTRNAAKIKADESFLKTARPNVVWIATEETKNLHVLKELAELGPKGLTNQGFSTDVMGRALPDYVPFILHHPDRMTVLFVRADCVQALQQFLDRQGFKLDLHRGVSVS